MMPPVVASERGRAQTHIVATPCGGCRTTLMHFEVEWKELERSAIAGESPLHEHFLMHVVS